MSSEMQSQEPRNDEIKKPLDGSGDARLMRRILASSFIGSMVEYYDFILYSVCSAIVFSKIFFSNLDPGFALFASFSTLAAGYVARPIGGIVFGHFGDRVGRKKLLVIAMFTMGISSAAIGVLPTNAQAGLIGPFLLVVLRFVQGIAVGGEFGGASLMALEHSSSRHRGFAASFASAGGPAGSVLATLVVSLFVTATGDQFLIWGWRVPFLLSIVLIAIGLVIRLQVTESPKFQEITARGKEATLPLFDVLKRHFRAVLIALLATLSFYCCQGLITVWGVAHVVELGVNQSAVLNVKAIGAVVTLVATFASARLSDRIGRRPVLIAAGVSGIVLAFPLLMVLDQGTLMGFVVADIVGSGLIQGTLYGPIAAFIAEQFPTHLRYTGSSLAFQSASTLGAGFTPMIASGLVILSGGAIWLVGVFWIAILIVGITAVCFTREGTEMHL